MAQDPALEPPASLLGKMRSCMRTPSSRPGEMLLRLATAPSVTFFGRRSLSLNNSDPAAGGAAGLVTKSSVVDMSDVPQWSLPELQFQLVALESTNRTEHLGASNLR